MQKFSALLGLTDREAYYKNLSEKILKQYHEKYVQNGFADIAGLNAEMLKNVGVNDVYMVDACTCCNPERFFSHRYSHGKRGVMGSGICL